MNILFTNCWMAGNSGDVAIWKNLMHHLSHAFPSATFLIASQTLLDWDINQLLGYKVQFYVNRINEAVKDADVVISQGGGYMIGDSMVPYLEAIKLAQDLGKPTFFSTQTFVGPISNPTKKLLKEVLNQALVISPRDQGSYNLLKKAGVNKKKMEILPDTVFDIGIANYPFPYPKAIKFAIRGFLASDSFIKEIARLANKVSDKIGQVVFIPVGHGADRDDREIAREIIKCMKYKAVLIEDKLTAEELKSTLKDGILVSDRYHGLIYAASMGTPFVAISADIGNKMEGLLSLFDYPLGEVLEKDSITTEKVFPFILDIWHNRDKYAKSLETRLPEVKEKAAKVYSKIIEGIRNANIT